MAPFKFRIRIWFMVKKIWFKVWQAFKIPIQKLPSFLKLGENTTRFQNLDSKRDPLWKSCLKIWSFWKLLIKTCFSSSFFTNSWFLIESITANSGVPTVFKDPKVIFWTESFHQILFFGSHFHFKIWCIVKLSFQNLTLCKTFD